MAYCSRRLRLRTSPRSNAVVFVCLCQRIIARLTCLSVGDFLHNRRVYQNRRRVGVVPIFSRPSVCVCVRVFEPKDRFSTIDFENIKKHFAINRTVINNYHDIVIHASSTMSAVVYKSKI